MKFFQPPNRIYRVIIPNSRLLCFNDEEKKSKYGDRLLFCVRLCFQDATVIDFPNRRNRCIEIVDLICHKMNKASNDETVFLFLNAKVADTLGYSASISDIFQFSGTLEKAINSYSSSKTSDILKDTTAVRDSGGNIVGSKYTFQVVDFWNNPQHPYHVLLKVDSNNNETVPAIQKAAWIRKRSE